ncbi:nucleotide exchange factor GrpE [uncultured Jatrophihabitans sp.]|uniref:nucleotide exchange factor GrpE n=1 Tax=uncultured Jatrophihabitans sp. TaxID=1610747 RepID=UPI0035C9AD7E
MTSSDRSHQGEPEEPPIRFTDNRKIDREASAAGSADEGASGPSSAEQAAAAAAQKAEEDVPKADALLLEERTRDLQRLQAEYANYRKRAERDRLAAGDAAVARVAGDFLPVLDDLDRARAHGDLTGALKAVADKLDDVFHKLGLESFGAVGDPFDPEVHEAVMHDVSDDVTGPTATTVMRQGYKYRDRLIRAAMVGVTDPASPSAEAEVADSAPDLAAGEDTLTDSTAAGEALQDDPHQP